MGLGQTMCQYSNLDKNASGLNVLEFLNYNSFNCFFQTLKVFVLVMKAV